VSDPVTRLTARSGARLRPMARLCSIDRFTARSEALAGDLTTVVTRRQCGYAE